MKSDAVYQALKDLAERLDINVSEQNLKTAGIHVRSGLCVIRGRRTYIMSKHERIHQKIELLAECLAQFPDAYDAAEPGIRDLLRKSSKGKTAEEVPLDG